MNILADQYLYGLEHYLPSDVWVDRFQPSDGLPEKCADYDALLIRTVTPINRQTLPKKGRLKFIGTATAGFDHVDREYLKECDIHFASAQGCNANAVGLYVATSLMQWALIREIQTADIRVGIVGCGHTGGRVKAHLDSLGIDCAEYDPPKVKREPGFHSVGVEELMNCEILTFHTPLTYGPDEACPTRHMCSHEWLKRGFKLVINAARGGVVDEKALLVARKEGWVEDHILDVWEGEPLFSDQAASHAFIATPHIAGYSVESKLRASQMVAEQMLNFFQIEPEGEPAPVQPDSGGEPKKGVNSPERMASLCLEMDIQTVADHLWKRSNIEYYDKKLRELCGKSDREKTERFAAIRSESRLRSEQI